MMVRGSAQVVARSDSSGPLLRLAAVARLFLVRWLAALQVGPAAWASSPRVEGRASVALVSRTGVWVLSVVVHRREVAVYRGVG
jgi:hypothetical protein